MITSGGLGTMGFGLPAAIGAQFGKPDSPVICFTGDGSIQMCIQELMVATIYKLPIKIVILNNQYLGMVRQWQELFWESHYSNVDLEASPRFRQARRSLRRLRSARHRCLADRLRLEKAMAITDRPCVLDFRIVKEANVYPMIPSNGTIKQMVVKQPEGTRPMDAYTASEYVEQEPGDDLLTQSEIETFPVASAAGAPRGGAAHDSGRGA